MNEMLNWYVLCCASLNRQGAANKLRNCLWGEGGASTRLHFDFSDSLQGVGLLCQALYENKINIMSLCILVHQQCL